MGIVGPWSGWEKSRVRRNVPDNLGVYQLADRNKNLLYIGEGELQGRLLDHFIDGQDPIPPTRTTASAKRTQSGERCRGRIRC